MLALSLLQTVLTMFYSQRPTHFHFLDRVIVIHYFVLLYRPAFVNSLPPLFDLRLKLKNLESLINSMHFLLQPPKCLKGYEGNIRHIGYSANSFNDSIQRRHSFGKSMYIASFLVDYDHLNLSTCPDSHGP